MATEVPREILDAIEAVMRQYPNGIAPEELANAFDPPANLADLDVWLQALGDQRRMMFFRRDGRMMACLPECFGGPLAAERKSAPAAGVRGSARESGDSPGPTPTGTGDRADLPPFVALFSQCVLPIVGGLMPRASATAFLQLQARQTFEAPEDRAGYLAYALAQLDVITPDFAPEYDLTAEQVSAWRLIYDVAQPESRPGAPSVTAAAESHPNVAATGPVGHNGGAAKGSTFTPDMAPTKSAGNFGRGQPGRPANAGGARPRVSTTAGVTLPLRAPDLQREVQAAVTDVARDMAREMATTWDLRASAKRAGEAMKATLTPGRGLFAVLWACAVFWAVQYYLKTAALHATASSAQRIALLGQMVGLGTVPLCGLPWLGFRWWDVRTRDGLTAVDVAMTLLVGGVLGLMLANVVVSLGSCMSGLMPN